MAGGSLAERWDAHQRSGRDEHRGAGQHALLDDFVRPHQERLGNRQAERLGNPEVDAQVYTSGYCKELPIDRLVPSCSKQV
jgi:hypothetical protein